MDFNHLPRSRGTSIDTFYDKITPLLDDLHKSQLAIIALEENVSPSRKIDGIPDEKMYGKITKEELLKVLESYEQQQGSNHTQNKPVNCDRIVGHNFSKLLFSKQGFHHLGSTSHLIEDLGLNDTVQTSFLGGGFSTYSLNKDDELGNLKLNRTRATIKISMKRADDYLTQGHIEKARQEIETALKLDRNNADALYLKGLYNFHKKCFSDSIDYFKKALDMGYEDAKKVKEDLANSYYERGVQLFFREDFEGSVRKFESALAYNKEHGGAIMHMNLSKNQILSKNPFGPKPLTYR